MCGSTRFGEAFRRANLAETLAGRIVLSIGCDYKSDDALGLTPDVKERLDELHLWKIDMADEVLVLNVGGYVGESTRREIVYAKRNGKPVRYLAPVEYDRVYVGKGRPQWRGLRCRIVKTWRGRGPRNVMIEFADGALAVCPARCLRKVKTEPASAKPVAGSPKPD